MRTLNKLKKLGVLLLLVLMQFVFFPVQNVNAAQSRVGMGTADSFAVLGGSGITNTGATTITGDIGTHPTTTISGLGSITLDGTNHAGDSVTQGAKTDLVTAYDDAAGRLPVTTVATELGGTTKTAGVYDSASGTFEITGTLTLNAEGNADAVFIFLTATTVVTAAGAPGSPGSIVALVNGAQACNVYWKVGSSATIGTYSTFIGNVFALTSITANTSATINGRLLARNGAVTLDTNTITKSACAAGTTGGPALAALTAAGPPGSNYCEPFESVAPIIIESRRIDADSVFISWGPYSGINTFIVEYGTENGKWLYNTRVTGFSTTLNNLPANTPIWVRVTATDYCSMGVLGQPKLVGGPGLPNAGFAPFEKNIPWEVQVARLVIFSVLLVLIQRGVRFLPKS